MNQNYLTKIFIKLFQRSITTTPETNEKSENLIIIEYIKEEPNGNYKKGIQS